jgi:hypothetical protein
MTVQSHVVGERQRFDVLLAVGKLLQHFVRGGPDFWIVESDRAQGVLRGDVLANQGPALEQQHLQLARIHHAAHCLLYSKQEARHHLYECNQKYIYDLKFKMKAQNFTW